MKTRSKWRLAGILATGMALLILVGLAVLHAPPTRRYALEWVREALRSQGLDLGATQFDYNLFTLNARLQSWTLRSSATPDLPPLVKASDLSVNLRWIDVLTGHFTVREARISGLAVEYVVDEHGRDNLPKSSAQEGESPAGRPVWDTIASLQISKASFLFEDRQRSRRLSLPLWQFKMGFESDEQNRRVRFSTDRSGDGAFEGRAFPIERLELEALLETRALKLKNLTVSAGGAGMEVSGSVDDFSDPDFDLSFKAAFDLDRISGYFPNQKVQTGNVVAEGSLQRADGRIRVSGRLRGDGISAAGYRQVGFQTQANWDSESQMLRLEALSARLSGGAIEATAALNLAGSKSASFVRARLRDLDLQPVTRLLGLPVEIATRATGSVSTRWQGDTIQGGEAQISLKSTRSRPSLNVLPVSGAFSARSRGSEASVSLSSVHLMGANLRGEVSIQSRRTLSGNMEGTAESLAAFLGELGSLLGRKKSEALVPLPVDGSVGFQSQIHGPVSNPSLSTAISIDPLQVGDVTGTQLKADTEVNAEGVVFRDLSLTWAGQTLSGQGELRLAGGQPSMDFRAKLEDGSFGSSLAALQDRLPIEGNYSADLRLSGTLTNPSASIGLSATSLKAYGESMGNLQVRARWTGDELELPELLLEKNPSQQNGGRLTAQGRYRPETQEYDLQADAGNLEFHELLLPGHSPLRGTLNLSATGSGTLADPSARLQLDAIDLQMGARQVGSFSANAVLAGQQVSLDMKVPYLNLAGTARIETSAPYPSEFTLSLDQADVSKLDFKIAEDQLLAGKLSATLKASGELDNWKRGELSAQISRLELSVGEHPLNNEGTVEFSYQDGVVNVGPAVVASTDSRIEIQGRVPVDETHPAGSLAVRGKAELGTVLAFVPLKEKVFASGLLDIDLSLQGTLERLTPAAKISLSDGFFYDPTLIMPFTHVGFAMKLENGTLVLGQATGQWALGTIQASGELPLSLLPGTLPFPLEGKSGPARFSLSARELQLDSIRTVPRDVAGSVSVRVDGHAPRLELPALSADVVFDALRFRVAEYAVNQSEPSRISLRDGWARIDQFQLAGPTTQIQASGQANLAQPQTVDLKLNASLDAGVFTFMSEDIKAGGQTQIQLGIQGGLDSPEFSGSLQTREGEFSIKSPRIQAENLNLLVRMNKRSITVEELNGTLNGGGLTGGGTIDYAGTELKKLNLKIRMNDVFLNVPEGLKTSASADLTLQSPEESILIAGSARIAEGSYREPVELGDQLLRNLSADVPLELAGERSPVLSKIRYNIAISTDDPILVDNNLAKLAADSNLRLVGTYYRPALTGRVSLGEGGEIYLKERKYLIERGVIDFISQNRIEPSLDILAKTQAGGEDIDLQLSGTFKDLTSRLTSPSDPDLSEPDIISLLLTGRTLEEFRGAELNVAKEQVLSYLAGRVGGQISRTAEQAFGLSQVRIEPNLIAAESDPGARLTVGQDLTRDLRLIYSMDLTDSQDQIWTAEYDLTKRFEAKATKQSDNSYRYDFRHDLRFGGHSGTGQTGSSAAKTIKKISSIEFLGKPVFSEKQLADQLKLKAGDKYDFFRVQNSLDRVQGFYAKQGHPEARIRLNREPQNDRVGLKLNVEAGPRVEFVFEGKEVTSDQRKKIEQAWREGVFDAQRAEESTKILRRGLVETGFLQPKVAYRIETPADDRKQVVLQIEPGARYRSVELMFEGASGVKPSVLESQIRTEKLENTLYLEPDKVADFLKRYYLQQGYLDAAIQPIRYELNPETGSGRVVIPVEEGRLYRVGRLQVRGNTVFADAELTASLDVSSGQFYRPEIPGDSTSRLEAFYWNQGYNDVVVTARPQRGEQPGLLDLVFEIAENRKGMIEDVQIEGNHRTSDDFVRSQLKFSVGDALDFDRINRSRKALYDAGAYSLVDLETEALDDKPAETGNIKRVGVRIKLREIQPYQVRYGAFFDTERGPGIIADATTRNFLGSARVLGLRTRFDGETRELRGYFSQPFFGGLALKSNLIGFRRREAPANLPFITDRMGFSLQQEARLKNKLILSYGYRLDGIHTFDKEPDPLFPFDITLPVARLTGTLTRENRDDLLDASRGSFSSHAFEFAPQSLGSDLRFVKYYGQYFKYLPLSEPTEIPWNDGSRKSRFVYAGGVRLGLAKGLGGQDVVSFERFFAGGGTTLRGYDQNRLGPVDFFGDPAGGEAVFIANNEIRFPLVHFFDGVGFLDMGNVYRKMSDFDLSEVRKSAGFGLRVRTPFLLLRLDYGFKLDRRPEESRGGFFFSIGQAF